MTERCEKKASLFREWQEATDNYAKAVAALTDNVGEVSESEYSRLKQSAEIARKLTKQIRTELDDHIATHACQRSVVRKVQLDEELTPDGCLTCR